MKLSIYRPSNIEEIKQLFTQTFSDSEGQSEGLIIGNLTYDLMLNTHTHELYGFIAIENEHIIGSIFFSKLTFEHNINAFLLAPVAVRTNYQGKGVGQKLINFGLNALKDNGVELIFTYGDPKFYSKVGFNLVSETLVKAPLKLTYPEGWLGQSLLNDTIETISGHSYCVEAFNKAEYW